MSEPLMPPLTTPPGPSGRPSGRPGVGFADVEKAADALLREGTRPTLDRLRERIGRGSPNTIQPLLDQWWKTLAARLDAGPAALHRIPESVAHIVEALWLQLLADARIRASQELSTEAQAQSADRQQLEVRSYVLSLREGELEERVRSRDLEIARLRKEGAGLTALLARVEAERDRLNAPKAKPPPARARRVVTPNRQTQGSRPARTRRPGKIVNAPPRRKKGGRTPQTKTPGRARRRGTSAPSKR
jgi:Plasmid replication region DNA-binding N-term